MNSIVINKSELLYYVKCTEEERRIKSNKHAIKRAKQKTLKTTMREENHIRNKKKLRFIYELVKIAKRRELNANKE